MITFRCPIHKNQLVQVKAAKTGTKAPPVPTCTEWVVKGKVKWGSATWVSESTVSGQCGEKMVPHEA